jgi:hypothetical protein
MRSPRRRSAALHVDRDVAVTADDVVADPDSWTVLAVCDGRRVRTDRRLADSLLRRREPLLPTEEALQQGLGSRQRRKAEKDVCYVATGDVTVFAQFEESALDEK